ncbi:anhydro-N-acetylmuramic acid kinase [Luteibacter sp. 329MFSha]|uniref:anhydro-N-acetylmuramic acid kinase n=1 Tax=Luteibacter sp. 329MFSha TaxID=1798239 RepID=UPI0008CCBE20|nr:anhydro-N-acetylmuramic acid kinase [Luteibacter sp. 329MFSha]SEW25863.1 anhydro-N-acetylmuramic acid kinase [Luteibacter sp. 329MFSha]
MATTDGLYLGLISGTSADGIDAALVRFTDGRPALVAGLTHPWEDALRTRILAVAQDELRLDLDAYGRLDVAVGMAFADAARAVIAKAGVPASSVTAIGSHGQTIRHRPSGTHPFTLQIGDASVIAERSGIDTVADFRRADVAAGGQGAPLVPAFHATVLRPTEGSRVVLNLGGIANVTRLTPEGDVTGFDTGPANGLMDAWCLRHRGEAFDRDGVFAASGTVDAALLAELLDDAYFVLDPPKSTGREHFHLAWLDEHPRVAELSPEDVQATLLALSAASIGDAIARYAPDAVDVVACGGGVHNTALMRALTARLGGRVLRSSAEFGIDPDQMEAMAFAWLAYRRVRGEPGNLPAVTGARGLRLLGAVYAAPQESR